MWASLHGHLDIVRILLEHGANANAKTNVRNKMMNMMMMMTITMNDDNRSIY